ncbi:MAG: cyclic nucleotide-binding domain-containing protein [bacterium]|nr:cyclic nucleotide-binding domain-containing protein [bacterium]
MDLSFIRQIELFGNLEEIHLAHLESILVTKEVPEGTVLFREGEHADRLYVIFKGRVRISKVMEGYGEEALAILNEGSYFGEMELIDPSVPCAAHAITHTDCVLYTFPFEELRGLLSSDRDLAVSFLWSMAHTLSHRLRATNDKVTAMFALTQFE